MDKLRHILIFFILSTLTLNAQEKYALLIGISNYPVESGWNAIHGANDIVIIRETLLKLGFNEANIKELTNSNATCSNIITGLENILKNVNRNDIVYIHFSGHGQRITDLDGDEEDGLDESWIPIDAYKEYRKGVYEGENHIIDDRLNDYLARLRYKVGNKGRIIVVSDACHSGSGSRGFNDEEIFKRGSSDNFVIPNIRNIAKRKEYPVEWLFVAACKSYQTNYEYRDNNGVYYGILSYSIACTADKLFNVTYNEAVSMWGAIVKERSIYPQNIDVEGAPNIINNNLF